MTKSRGIGRGGPRPNSGGKRPGSGRKPLAEPTEKETICLTKAQQMFCRAIGGGQLSRGVRMVIDNAMRRGHTVQGAPTVATLKFSKNPVRPREAPNGPSPEISDR